MNKYQFSLKTESGLGKVFYYCYAEDRFETFLNIKNIKYRKNWENQGRNLFDELQQELQRKDNIINELKELILNDINFPELCDRDKIENKFKELEERK